ncbi:DNA N-glycosylase and apurinic/apyrimidinic (AP) lyase [Loxospora ochrophaea]|nr:DNA N-glycosylase and apurinic/apyrimidinic (AP) lyase [Loxospora ochrophaea]
MRTSRIARDTSRVINSLSPIKPTSKRQTRSFAASLASYSAAGTNTHELALKREEKEEFSEDESPLSSPTSNVSFDIEETPLSLSPSRKRKRGKDTAPSSLISTSNGQDTKKSPRASKVKEEDGKTPRRRRQPAKKTVNSIGDVEVHPPSNWEEVYDTMKEMRKTLLAPVDTMGCEELAEDHRTPLVNSNLLRLSDNYFQSSHLLTRSPKPQDKRFQTLISLMLSSQTKDTTNALTMRRLQTELPPPGLTLENILDVSPERLNELIYAVGFHNNKTRYIKAAAIILREKYNGDIPDTVEGLMSLPGVGPKMAYLCMSAAWGRTEGIGVDVHVHRITNLWGWHKTKNPEETRAALEAWLPKDRWHEINKLLVGFGQSLCLPVGRRCDLCKLSEKKLCPGAVRGSRKVVKKIKNEVVATGEETAMMKEEAVLEAELI